MRRIRSRVLLVVLAMAISSATACQKAPPNLSPVGVTAFNNTRVIKALDLLRDTAVDANAQVPPLLTTEITGKVVRYHKLAITGLHDGVATPSTLKAGLDDLVTDLPVKYSQLLSPYVGLIKTVIDEVVK
jgi:hypothetical protein